MTKNERKVLKTLLSNSRTPDSEIASQLKISSQAVGKIRRKLEGSIIQGYSLKLDFAKIGIQTFAIGIAKMTMEGLDKGELEVEQVMLTNPHILHVYRIPRGSSTHILIYGFRDINEFDNFFNSAKMREELHRFLEVMDLFTFSHNSLVKNNSEQLFQDIIDNLDNPMKLFTFDEIERFKAKIQ